MCSPPSWTSALLPSTARKSNIRNIDGSLDKIAQLRGVYFDWDHEHGGAHDMGFIAEEVGAALPEIVWGTKRTGSMRSRWTTAR
ncbi:MAG: tail fiber domain-containing protein [Phycisphaerales bacterium]|nr:tail fiber domain-containing protein [Phycisphaerales bacterium]